MVTKFIELILNKTIKDNIIYLKEWVNIYIYYIRNIILYFKYYILFSKWILKTFLDTIFSVSINIVI